MVNGIDRFQQLIDDSSTLPSKRDDARRSIAALEAFLNAHNVLELGKYTFKECPRLAPLVIEGVKIPTTLDLLTTSTIKGKEYQGGVILRLTLPEDSDAGKSRRDTMGGFTATLALMQIESKLPIAKAEPLPKLCLAIDVQTKLKYEAKAGTSQKRANILAACTMIKNIWPSV